MYVIGLDNKPLDAKCHILKEDGYFGLVLESWGQKNNPDYNKALRVLVERLKISKIRKLRVFLASEPVRKNLPSPDDRSLGTSDDGYFYIESEDSETLRLKLCKEQKFFNTTSRTNIARGNGTKRILLHVQEFTRPVDWEKIIIGEMASSFEPTDRMSILNERVEQILQHTVIEPVGCANPEKNTRQTIVYLRDPSVVAWVLRNSQGICEYCDMPAPFYKKENVPFLEVHHVKPLSEDGPDLIENCVALCPNCHRAMHLADDASVRLEKLYHKVSRLTKS